MARIIVRELRRVVSLKQNKPMRERERERERERNCRHTRDWWKARGVASSLRERGVGTFKWRSSVTHAHGTQRPLTKTEAILTVLICETSGMEAVEPPSYEKA